MAISREDFRKSEIFNESLRYRSSHSLEWSWNRDRGVYGLMPSFKETVQRSFINPFPEEAGPVGFDFKVGYFIAESDVLKSNVSYLDITGIKNRRYLREGDEVVLEANEDGERVYYIMSKERINFPSHLELIIDSKSTTGRVGAMCQRVGQRSEGEIIWAVQCYSFPLRITAGETSLAQAIVRFAGSPYMSFEQVKSSTEISVRGNGKLEDAVHAAGLRLGFGIDNRAIYVAKDCREPLDMNARGMIDWERYFELREMENEKPFLMEKKRLHLLGTCEYITLGKVCGLLGKHDGVHTGSGMWGNFAGIFQPGFSGQITLEAYSSHNREIKHNDSAGFVVFDEMQSKLDDELYQGTYQNQSAPHLPKMFKTKL